VIALGTLVLVVRTDDRQFVGRTGAVVGKLTPGHRWEPAATAYVAGIYYDVRLAGDDYDRCFRPSEIVPIAPPAPPVQTTRDVDIGLVV
jgi:hypothetical protein